MRRLVLVAVAGSTPLLSGCATPSMDVTPTGRALDLQSRNVDCVVEFYRARPPDRPFDEIATLHLESQAAGAFGALLTLGAWDVQERIRKEACALGADAVIVTRDARYGGAVEVTGTAVSYPEMRASAEARSARDARGIADLVPPPGFTIAMARATTPLFDRPGADAIERGRIDAGTGVWAARDSQSENCRVRHPDGRDGWTECGALELGRKPAATGAEPGGAKKTPRESELSI